MVAGGWPESDVIDERRRDEAPWVRSAILAGKPFHYRRLPAWAHNALNLGALVGVLGVVAVTLALGRGATPWPYVPAAGVVFGLASADRAGAAEAGASAAGHGRARASQTVTSASNRWPSSK